MAALFQGAEDAHQDRLHLGAGLAAVGVTVFADNHGGTNRSFASVVVVRNLLVVQERKQFAPAFNQSRPICFG